MVKKITLLTLTALMVVGSVQQVQGMNQNWNPTHWGTETWYMGLKLMQSVFILQSNTDILLLLRK